MTLGMGKGSNWIYFKLKIMHVLAWVWKIVVWIGHFESASNWKLWCFSVNHTYKNMHVAMFHVLVLKIAKFPFFSKRILKSLYMIEFIRRICLNLVPSMLSQMQTGKNKKLTKNTPEKMKFCLQACKVFNFLLDSPFSTNTNFLTLNVVTTSLNSQENEFITKPLSFYVIVKSAANNMYSIC